MFLNICFFSEKLAKHLKEQWNSCSLIYHSMGCFFHSLFVCWPPFIVEVNDRSFDGFVQKRQCFIYGLVSLSQNTGYVCTKLPLCMCHGHRVISQHTISREKTVFPSSQHHIQAWCLLSRKVRCFPHGRCPPDLVAVAGR